MYLLNAINPGLLGMGFVSKMANSVNGFADEAFIYLVFVLLSLTYQGSLLPAKSFIVATVQ
jgi:hypothetical protein